MTTPSAFPSSIFEKTVLSNSNKLFKPSKKWQKGVESCHPIFNTNKRKSISNPRPFPEDNSEEEQLFKNKSSIWWWEPPPKNLAVEFFNETSTHGLNFLFKPKRHLSERIFWVVGFLAGLAAAVFLINAVWKRYNESPVIVTFQPKEQDIDSIPFPAVTFCNINKFPKSTINKLERIANYSNNEEERKSAVKDLVFARSVCNAQHSFARKFNYAASRGVGNQISENDTISEDDQNEMIEFLLDNTIPCNELIRLCIFGEKKYDCGELFKPIITDVGKCCSFNVLPTSLLLLNPNANGSTDGSTSAFEDETENPDKGRKKRWSDAELATWKQWNYKDGMVMNNKETVFPYRQKRAGMTYGLSILVDPNIEDYFCPASDSEGLRYILHTALEMPHVMEFASILELGKEIYVDIIPEVTNADDKIRQFSRKIRQCYFAGEKQLLFFQPYTASNCIDECTALVIASNCNCSYFYLPRFDGVKICNNDQDSEDSACINKARVGLLDTLKDECGHCDNLCDDIKYHHQTTVSSLQNPSKIWKDPKGNMSVPIWADHKMSIVHLYFGSDSTVPKLRQRMYDDVDLVASTGGLLGLCLGVSILSAVEAIYFFTLRAFWKYYYRKRTGKNLASKFAEILKKKVKGKKKDSEQGKEDLPEDPEVLKAFYPTHSQMYETGYNLRFPRVYGYTEY